MMYQSKSKTAGKLGSLVLVPALAIGMAVVSIPAVASLISDASAATLTDSVRKVTKNPANPETPDTRNLPAGATQIEEITVVGAAQADTYADARAEEPVSEPSVEQTPAVMNEEAQEKNNKEVFVAVEKQAEFPGGIPALMKWLCENVRYPEDAQKASQQGRVIVKFIVNADGSVSDATVQKGVSPSLDQEAIRVVLAMPKWQPAENGGRKVASYFNLPITFKLTPSTPKDSVPAKQ